MTHTSFSAGCNCRTGICAAIVCCVLLLGSFFYCPSARAEGFALYEWSARGVALGGSTMARRPDASAIAYNPAQITRLPGMHLMGGISLVTPHGKISTRNGGPHTDTVNTRTWYIPHLYYTHQLNDRWTLGIGEFSRYGLGFKYDRDWIGRYNARAISLETVSINPVLAFKATDKLSLAGGVEFIYCNLDITKSVGNPLLEQAQAEVESQIKGADGVAVGANLAAHYQFNDNWAVGVSYRSQATVTARGENEFKITKSSPSPMVPDAALKEKFPSSGARGTVTLPDSIGFGVAWMPTEKFSLETGATWTRWSTFRSLTIHLGDPMNQVSESKKQWKNSWRLNVGAEYDVTDWLALRLGYVYDQSPMTSEYADYLVPTNGRHIYSVGTGIKYDNWTFDAAYGYVDIDGRSYQHKNGAENNYHGVVDSKTHGGMSHILSFSLGYHF